MLGFVKHVSPQYIPRKLSLNSPSRRSGFCKDGEQRSTACHRADRGVAIMDR